MLCPYTCVEFCFLPFPLYKLSVPCMSCQMIQWLSCHCMYMYIHVYIHIYILHAVYSMAQSGSTNERGSPIGVVEGDGVDDVLVSL